MLRNDFLALTRLFEFPCFSNSANIAWLLGYYGGKKYMIRL